MILSLPVDELKMFVLSQLEHFYPDGQIKVSKVIKDTIFSKAFDLALERLEYCIQHVYIQGWKRGGVDGTVPMFYHLNSDQYSQFLYFLSNSLWKLNGDKNICDKLILLNKALHGIWYSYKNNLPNIFVFMHPVGTILGNANYSDYLYVRQNVTVNTITKPGHTFGKGLMLSAGAKIIGEENIGDWVSIGVDACVYKREIPSNSLVYRDNEGAIRVKEYYNRKFLEYAFGLTEF